MAASHSLRVQQLGLTKAKASPTPEMKPQMKSSMGAKDVSREVPKGIPSISQPDSCAANCGMPKVKAY